jgi:hypothetical protein
LTCGSRKTEPYQKATILPLRKQEQILEIFLFQYILARQKKNIYAELVVSKWHSGPGPLNIGKTAASTSSRAGGILKKRPVKNSAEATL